jgi:hypothetical protein
MTDQPISPQASKNKKRLISYRAWIMILTLSLLATISHLVPSESLDYAVGRFIGSLLLFSGVWALVALAFRWISRRSRKST